MRGLPWTNPLKIQVGSDEHIVDTTINRGLMMLLNNDYYLDMKSNILSKELSSVISNMDSMWNKLEMHLADEDMHYNDTVKITYENHNQYTYNYSFNTSTSSNNDNNSKLYKDTVKYLSIGWNAPKIQQVIDEVPHDLNRIYAFIYICSSYWL